MINIAVCGANGKMGQEVIKAVNEAEDMALVAKIDIKDGDPFLQGLCIAGG